LFSYDVASGRVHSNQIQLSLNVTTMSHSVRVSYVFADVHFLHFSELKM